MKSLVDVVMAWPIIVQGALGSALFWLVLTLSQIAATRLNESRRKLSKKRKLKSLLYAILKYKSITGGDDSLKATYMGALLFAASRPLFKGLICLSLGLFIQETIYVFGLAGFIGAIMYFSQAIYIVQPLKRDKKEDKAKKLSELAAEYNKLQKEVD